MAEEIYTQDSKTDSAAPDRTEGPAVQVPPLRGDFYFSRVPDTLDLAERAALAINALTRCTNPEKEYAVYFNVNFHRNPPTMSRQFQLYGKFMEGLALMRRVTGSDFNLHVEQTWRQSFLRMLKESRPVLAGPEGGRQLAWIAINYLREKDLGWKKLGEEAIHRILQTVVDKGDYCYFPRGSSGEYGSHDEYAEMPKGWDATFQGWTLQGVTQFYKASPERSEGSQTAQKLAGKLARYLKNYAEVFDSKARFMAHHYFTGRPALHFHHNANALEGIAEYAHSSGDKEFLEFAKMGYEYARSIGSPLVGFFPEYIDEWPDDRNIVDCETCCVADMILLALWLTEAGQGDYWDDVDRYIRNQFAEMQMTHGDWINRITKNLPRAAVGAEETAENVRFAHRRLRLTVSERCVGSFAGWATANDFYAGVGSGIMFASLSGYFVNRHCCTGNGSRALYHVFKNIVEFSDSELRVNLLLNHASSWADILSYIPNLGQVDVKIKKPCASVAIRVPEWVKGSNDQVICRINDRPHELHWEGRYVTIGKASPGDTIILTFPISERTVKETVRFAHQRLRLMVGGVPYTFILRGNDVVDVSPPGKNYPFYQREHYRNNVVRWKTVRRFVEACD